MKSGTSARTANELPTQPGGFACTGYNLIRIRINICAFKFTNLMVKNTDYFFLDF